MAQRPVPWTNYVGVAFIVAAGVATYWHYEITSAVLAVIGFLLVISRFFMK